MIALKEKMALSRQEKSPSNNSNPKNDKRDNVCLKFLSELLGAECKEVSPDTFELKQNLRAKFLHYKLSKRSSTEMTYIPIAANVSLEQLPEYLADEMTFKRADMPIFLYQLSKWLASTSQ